MEENDYTTEASVEQKDDALFEALGKHKKRKKRKVMIAVVSIVLALAILAAASVVFLQRRVHDTFAAEQGEVLSAAVNVGSISTVVTGSGKLVNMDLKTVAVPEGVVIEDVVVKANQRVAEGEILATVDMTSVTSTLANLQTQIEALDARITDAEDDAASKIVCAGVSGRVKLLYAKAGDNVADVMYANSALALISLDGYMSVTVRSNGLKPGDNVTVALSNGKKIPGSVASVSGLSATVLVTDNGTTYADNVTVLGSDGKELGTGSLKINNPLRVTGYAGTVASVNVAENALVTENTQLFILKDTDYNASYNTLLRQRAELEQVMLELLAVQQDGAVLSPYEGSIHSVDHSETAATAVVTMSMDYRMSITVDVDESDILSLRMGQRVAVNVPSVGNREYSGLLMEVNRSSSTGTYSAVVELDKTRGMLPGMTANVAIRIRGVDGVLLVPVDAVHKTRNGAYVYTSYDEKHQEYGGKMDVVTGMENGEFVEIKTGIKIGDTVYYTQKQTESNEAGGIAGLFGGWPGSQAANAGSGSRG